MKFTWFLCSTNLNMVNRISYTLLWTRRRSWSHFLEDFHFRDVREDSTQWDKKIPFFSHTLFQTWKICTEKYDPFATQPYTIKQYIMYFNRKKLTLIKVRTFSLCTTRVRKSRYWGETLQFPHPLLWRNEASLLVEWRTMYFPLALWTLVCVLSAHRPVLLCAQNT